MSKSKEIAVKHTQWNEFLGVRSIQIFWEYYQDWLEMPFEYEDYIVGAFENGFVMGKTIPMPNIYKGHIANFIDIYKGKIMDEVKTVNIDFPISIILDKINSHGTGIVDVASYRDNINDVFKFIHNKEGRPLKQVDVPDNAEGKMHRSSLIMLNNIWNFGFLAMSNIKDYGYVDCIIKFNKPQGSLYSKELKTIPCTVYILPVYEDKAVKYKGDGGGGKFVLEVPSEYLQHI